MDTKIYYYSSTGNSLYLAKALANGLGGAELVSMPKALGGAATGNAARVGFVFPVIAWGVPRIVAEFLKGLKLEGKPYVFAVATCGGTPGPALKELRGLLRKAGADLDAGFVCREGANFVSPDPGFVTAIKRLNHVVLPSGEDRLAEFIETIRGNRKHAPETSSFAVNAAGGFMHNMMKAAGDKMKAVDSNYTVDDRCAGCRTCERVCPRGNVKVESGKPVWHHNCEMCNACIQWCPQKAIHVPNETGRYHHPAVCAEEIMIRK